MKRIFGLVALFIFLLSCNDSEEPIVPEKDSTVRIETYYQLNSSNSLFKDSYSKVFVYYGYETYEIIGSDIDENGKLTKNNKVILPNISSKTGVNGICEFISAPEILDKAVTFIIVSNYTELILTSNYSNSHSDIIVKFIAREN